MMDETGQVQGSYAMPVADYNREEFERWRFTIDDILVEFEYNLLGYFWDKTADSGKGAWSQKGKARVNEEGAKAIIMEMGGIINKISTLTTLNIDEILMETRMLAINLNRMFFLHHDAYGIETPTDAQALLWHVVFFVFNGLKQSEGAIAMRSLAEAGRTIRHVYTEQGGGKQGFFHMPGKGG